MFPKAAAGECCGTKAAPPPPAKPSPTRTAPRAHPCGTWGQGEGPWPCGDSATSPRALQAPSRASAPGAGRGESGSCCTLEAGRVLLRRGRGWGEPRVVLMPQPPPCSPVPGQAAIRTFLTPSPQEPGFCPSGAGTMELHVARAEEKPPRPSPQRSPQSPQPLPFFF